jgi:hypothetical protein
VPDYGYFGRLSDWLFSFFFQPVAVRFACYSNPFRLSARSFPAIQSSLTKHSGQSSVYRLSAISPDERLPTIRRQSSTPANFPEPCDSFQSFSFLNQLNNELFDGLLFAMNPESFLSDSASALSKCRSEDPANQHRSTAPF